ncbi:hypothetical protein FisN_24Hh094 [Fistulifera solaris]|uniref:Acyltransferase n=1 Tax=Fistulifera solaris TaxID=1519565 RepID=A0A1Z5JFH9_FISSO|nr:hypothetical protein FisN_24Hh094 [Fistulifera solaris]|eukprot:GAX12518.1 hypothetical protein FisN_24Hh094 [Fistulifera solaris]
MKKSQAGFLDFCGLSLAEKVALSKSPEQRQAAALPIEKVTKEHVLKVEPMKWWEEVICVLFLAFGVPNGAITIPIVTTLLGYFVVGSIPRAFAYLLMALLPLAILPQAFVPATLHSQLAHLIAKYFSFRFAYEDSIMTHDPVAVHPNTRPQILVAPPHGVFPYGNILSMLAWPSLSGHHFIGLASSAALRPPLFKQILRSIGVVDADRHTAQRQLEQYPYTIGISTGGVAEVFVHGDEEVILLKERVGLIKLALRTGADLVPCYVFGNTQVLLSWWFRGVENLRKSHSDRKMRRSIPRTHSKVSRQTHCCHAGTLR